MRKTDKKMDNALRVILTEACELARGEYEGFEWLTHFANYKQFPESLLIVCIYDTNANLAKTDPEGVCAIIKQKLKSIDVNIKDIRKHIRFDTEEDCENENHGKWHERWG